LEQRRKRQYGGKEMLWQAAKTAHALEDQGKAEEVLEPDHKECGIPSHDKIRTPHISTCISLPIS
jgi:hypothetical protein